MENKYNILFTLNSSYIMYGKLFINSLYDNNDMDKVNKVYLADTGLDNIDKHFFNSFPHIEIIETNISSNFNEGGTWGEGWSNSVVSKTQTLYKILKKSPLPVMMIDADCIILKDLFPLISYKVSMQLCCRKPHSIPYLGSFLIAHPDKNGKEFVLKWINNINNSSGTKAKESPNLGITVSELKHVKIEDIPRLKVSCYNKNEYNDDVFIVHLKGSSLSNNIEEDYKKRIYGEHGFDLIIKKYSNV
mgnify:CR=1 FL=1|tara:strand:- start:170 stop:907 length:738 start_codon:yes stop_codon:yes gene_type:complete